MEAWHEEIKQFILLADKHKVRMLMVGGGAVNYYGYQRHSADVDFWIETKEDNLKKLLNVFTAMNYDIDSFPDKVKEQQQNISLKFSPALLNIELITNFSINKSFEQAFKDSKLVKTEEGPQKLQWRVIAFEDLIDSKVKSGRAKDLLDIQELQKIQSEK